MASHKFSTCLPCCRGLLSDAAVTLNEDEGKHQGTNVSRMLVNIPKERKFHTINFELTWFAVCHSLHSLVILNTERPGVLADLLPTLAPKIAIPGPNPLCGTPFPDLEIWVLLTHSFGITHMSKRFHLKVSVFCFVLLFCFTSFRVQIRCDTWFNFSCETMSKTRKKIFMVYKWQLCDIYMIMLWYHIRLYHITEILFESTTLNFEFSNMFGYQSFSNSKGSHNCLPKYYLMESNWHSGESSSLLPVWPESIIIIFI